MQPDIEIWLDNHFSPILAKWLSEELGIIVKSNYILKFQELTDIEIYEKARQHTNEVVLLSKDTDLDEIISIKGSPPKLISVKTYNTSNKILFDILKKEIPIALKLLKNFKKDIIEITKQNI